MPHYEKDIEMVELSGGYYVAVALTPTWHLSSAHCLAQLFELALHASPPVSLLLLYDLLSKSRKRSHKLLYIQQILNIKCHHRILKHSHINASFFMLC